MKLGLLIKVCERFGDFGAISSIKRVENNILKLSFDKQNHYFMDMSKGNSLIFKKEGFEHSKDFNAPFDVLLSKRFSNAKIEKIYLHNDDKILRIVTFSASSYKKIKSILQLEFTGKYTNAIILDENEIVLEALRHISENISSRIVKVGCRLEELHKIEFQKKEFELFMSVDEYLLMVRKKFDDDYFEKLKNTKVATILKQSNEVDAKLSNLPKKEELQKIADFCYQKANLLLANLSQIATYAQEFELTNFDGEIIKYEILPEKSLQSTANAIFSEAKKLKQKAQNCHIEKQNLEEKQAHLAKMVNLVKSAKSIDELEFYFPKKDKNQKTTKKQEFCQTFIFKGYKIMVGRSSKENEWLLKNAKASDFWFHLKDRPSAHVIVGCSKKELPQNVIFEAALIVAKFSCEFGGGYEVDFTQRRNIKIQNGSNTTYTEYKTIFVKI